MFLPRFLYISGSGVFRRSTPSNDNPSRVPLEPTPALSTPLMSCVLIRDSACIAETVLLQDGREVRLGDIVGEGAVSEDDCGFSGGRQLGVPFA